MTGYRSKEDLVKIELELKKDCKDKLDLNL